MFIIKNYYFLYTNNTRSINFKSLKRNKKYSIIYRTITFKKESLKSINIFRKKCNIKKIKFYVANDYNLAKKTKADGLYLSAYNKSIHHNINVIGSAHNYKEINQKIKQNCKIIFLSRLFKTGYKNKESFYGLLKFNLMIKNFKVMIIPLGGINKKNLLKINLINSDGFGIMSEVKKKPAISNRLF